MAANRSRRVQRASEALDVGEAQVGAPELAVAKIGAHESEARITNAYLRRSWQNPRLVSALVNGEVVRVKVRNRDLFAPGMVVPVTFVSAGVWQCLGSPKRRGQWA